jgi:hypothetical protein
MLPPGEYYTMQETADGRYTGLKLLESLRHIDSALGRNVRIFVLTNWRDEPQIDAACRSFRAEIIRKPMSIKMMDDLCNRVKSIS